MCKLFVERLVGLALDWFSKLEKRSIGSCTQLSTAFVKLYSVFMEKVTSDADIQALSQGPNDSLQTYMKKFKKTLANMSSVNDLHALGVMA